MTIKQFGELLDCLFEQHKFVRRALLAWVVWIITWATLRVFDAPDVITNGTALAYGSLVTLLTVVLGLYQWGRSKEDQK